MPSKQPPSTTRSKPQTKPPVPLQSKLAEQQQVAAEQIATLEVKLRDQEEAAEKMAADAADAAQLALEEKEEIQQALQDATERELLLSTLLASAGHDSIALGAIDWSVGNAKQLLEEEVAAMAKVDAMLACGREQSSAVRAMIAQQQALPIAAS